MSLVRENITPPKYMEHLIFGALFVLALGLLTSTSILALSHILMLVPCVYFAFHTNWKEMPKSAWALLGLSIAIMLSVAVNQDIMVKGWKPIFKVKYFLFGFFSIVPFHWWIKNKMTEKKLQILLYTFLIATTVATVAGVIGKFTGINPITFRKPDIIDRNSGLFGMVMNYAHNMSYFLILLPGIYILQKKFKEVILNKFVIVVFLINLVGIYFSYTRGAWLALIAGLPFYLYFKNKKLFIVSGVLLVLLGIGGYFVAGKKVIRADSDNQRISQWKAAFEAFKDRPVLGYGYLNFEDHSVDLKKKHGFGHLELASHAHNNFMEMLGAVGVIGFLTFFIWLILWWKESVDPLGVPFIVTFIMGGLTQSTIALGINLFFVLTVYSIILKINFSQNLKQSCK